MYNGKKHDLFWKNQHEFRLWNFHENSKILWKFQEVIREENDHVFEKKMTLFREEINTFSRRKRLVFEKKNGDRQQIEHFIKRFGQLILWNLGI